MALGVPVRTGPSDTGGDPRYAGERSLRHYARGTASHTLGAGEAQFRAPTVMTACPRNDYNMRTGCEEVRARQRALADLEIKRPV